MKVGCLASTLKHIGLIEEEDLKVFMDVVDDRSTPTSPLPPSATDERALSLLPSNIMHEPTRSSRSVEVLTLTGGACQELSKAMSVRGMKSSTCKKTQHRREVVPSFNLWRNFSRSSSKDTSEFGLENILPSSASSI